jgi:hypothetical protein
VAAQGRVWNSAPNITGGVTMAQLEGLGLVVRFNEFFHYTGGDLPRHACELIATAVTANGLPNPLGGPALPPAAQIASIKCGIHGEDVGTSVAFLNTATPSVAFISSGRTTSFLDRSPSQAVVDKLHNHALIDRFYLTHCDFARNNVPASTGAAQAVAGNKSRVCGDNSALDDGQHVRGHVVLVMSEANSVTPMGLVVAYRDANGTLVTDPIYP